MTNKTRTTRQPTQPTEARTDADTPMHVELAVEAVLEGWTREQVINTLISRISQDHRYLAYRKACNRRTSYDDQVQQDMRALALAAVLLEEVGPGHLGVVHDTSPTLMPRSHLGGVGQG